MLLHVVPVLLGPSLHVLLQVALGSQVLVVEISNLVEALTDQTAVQITLERGRAVLISILELHFGAASLVLVKGLSEEALAHLVEDDL